MHDKKNTIGWFMYQHVLICLYEEHPNPSTAGSEHSRCTKSCACCGSRKQWQLEFHARHLLHYCGIAPANKYGCFVNKFLMKKGVLGEVFGDILLLKRLDEFEERSPLFGFFYISDR